MRAVEHERALGIDRQRGGARNTHRLNGGDPDDRHVETHVLLRLRDFDNPHTRTREMPRSADDLVGPLHRFDGDHGLVLHRNGLADVERGNGIGHAVTKHEVLMLLLVRHPRGQGARPREQRMQKRRRIEQLDSRVAHDVGDRRNQCIGIPRPEPCEHRQQDAIRHDAGEDLHVLHLAGHHGLRDPGRFENLDARAELTERNPVKVGPRLSRRCLEIDECLFLDRHNCDVVAEAASPLQHEKRKSAVPGNETDFAHA